MWTKSHLKSEAFEVLQVPTLAMTVPLNTASVDAVIIANAFVHNIRSMVPAPDNILPKTEQESQHRHLFSPLHCFRNWIARSMEEGCRLGLKINIFTS